jgi:hypothetical protein
VVGLALLVRGGVWATRRIDILRRARPRVALPHLTARRKDDR